MNAWLAALGTVAALAVALGIAWPLFRSKSTEATIELLRSELGIERDARQALDRRCNEETAELRGQISVLSSSFADALADRVAGAIAGAVVEALGRGGVIDRRTER